MNDASLRRLSSLVCACAGRLIALCVVVAAAPATATRVYVVPVQASDPNVARIVGGGVGTALVKAVPGVELVSADALSAVTEVAAERECLADDAASSCLTELADALDVDYLVRVQVAPLDDDLVLSLALIDGRHVRVVGQGQRTAAHGDHAALLRALPGLAREVAGAAGLPVSPSPYVGPIVVAGLGAVVGAAGGVVLGVRGAVSGMYADGRLSGDDASRYEQLQLPALVGGIAGVATGVVAVAGAAVVAGSTYFVGE